MEAAALRVRIPPTSDRSAHWRPGRFVVPRLTACLLLSAAAVIQSARADIPWEEAKARTRQENERLASRPQGHDGTYFVICTLYYTPKESGFTAERGFNATMETRPGLNGNMYPRDFLRAVKLEGYGRITTPVKGKNYIAYDGGRYVYDSAPKGRGITPLEPRASAAVRLGQAGLKGKVDLETNAPAIEEVFGSTRWKIIDTGGGLKRWQLDLYWGEDEPRGPDSIGRPRGTDFEYAYSEVTIRPAKRGDDAVSEPRSSPAEASPSPSPSASPDTDSDAE